MFSKIWLSKPHFENDDVDFFKKTMESNWISTVGPHIGDFENGFAGVEAWSGAGQD